MVAERSEMADIPPVLEVGTKQANRDANQKTAVLVSEARHGNGQAWSARFVMRAPGALRHDEETTWKNQIPVNNLIIFRGPGFIPAE